MSGQPRVAVIVLAAGSGERLGHSDPKAFVMLAGRTILSRALENVFAMRERPQVIVTAPRSYLPVARQIAASVPGGDDLAVTVVAGGASRQKSVGAGLEHLLPTVEAVLLHDAARPFTPTVVFDSIAAECLSSGVAVIPGLPVVDTIKRIDEDGIVRETIDRSVLASVQTPQGIPRHLLEEAHAHAEDDYTDDAALVARNGHPVTVIAGDQLAFKITTAWDFRQAESLLARAVGPLIRIGTGVDVHRFDEGRVLHLACLEWPGEPGLAGHSDGDVVAHAICDALLSAARLGDMGSVFGTSDPQYENAPGQVFLSRTAQLVHEEGFDIGNVVVQLVGNRPRMGARRREAELLISDLLSASVSITATTSDALGFTGRGEGLAAIATVLLRTRVTDDGLHTGV